MRLRPLTPAEIRAVFDAAERVPGVAEVRPEPVAAGEEGTLIQAFLARDPYSTAAYDVIPELREAVRGVSPDALGAGRWGELGVDSLDAVELILESEGRGE